MRASLVILMASVALVLLITCANLAKPAADARDGAGA